MNGPRKKGSRKTIQLEGYLGQSFIFAHNRILRDRPYAKETTGKARIGNG